MAEKPERKRRQRSDSVAFQAAIMQDVLKGTEPPDCVTIKDHERPFWDIVINAKAQWSEVDLIHAAGLARALAAIEHESKLLAEEGCVFKKKNGDDKLNPRIRALQALITLSLNYSVKIQVHAVATTGRIEDNLNKNLAKKQAIEAARNNASEFEDNLIARPHH